MEENCTCRGTTERYLWMKFLFELIMNYTLLYNYSAITSDVLSGIPYHNCQGRVRVTEFELLQYLPLLSQSTFCSMLFKIVSPALPVDTELTGFLTRCKTENRAMSIKSQLRSSLPSKLQRKRTRRGSDCS